MLDSKHAHRMVKARAPQYYNTLSPTQTAIAVTSSPSQSAVTTPLPTSTAALAGVVSFLALALLVVLGTCFYRRRQSNSTRNKAPSAAFDFNRDAFTEKKSAYSPSFDQHVRVNITTQMLHSKSPGSQTSISTQDSEDTSTTSTPIWKPQVNAKFRVTNDGEGTSSMPAVPKAVAEKKRSSKSKPWVQSLNLNPEDVVGSPPPSYDIASGGQQFLFPAPAQLPREKTKAIPTPPTPPANKKSHAPAKKANFPGQNLVIPTETVSRALPSPARSESFAPKDMLLPTPPASASSKASSSSSSPSINDPFSAARVYNVEGKAVRLMNVIAPYTPTLSDELQVRVGETVRVLQEYKDGWCFAQFVGKVGAPRGVVPLVCLEDRRRVVPVAHKTSNSSLMSLVNWR